MCSVLRVSMYGSYSAIVYGCSGDEWLQFCHSLVVK